MGGRKLRVRALGGNRAGEIRLTRFLRNAAVTEEAIVAEAGRRTGLRCAGLHVLAIQDTTVVRSAGGGGLYLHPVLAVDAASGAILGLTHAEFLSRSGGKKGSRKSRPIAEKESQRWLDGAERSAEACGGAARLTVIGDRENDIYHAFARSPEGADLLVRAAHDRALEDGGRLFAQLDAQAVAGRARRTLTRKAHWPTPHGSAPSTAPLSPQSNEMCESGSHQGREGRVDRMARARQSPGP